MIIANIMFLMMIIVMSGDITCCFILMHSSPEWVTSRLNSFKILQLISDCLIPTF